MPTTQDLYRVWLLQQLGLPTNSALSVSDLESLFYANPSYGVATNRRYAPGAYYAQDNSGGNGAASPVLNELLAFAFPVGKKTTFDRLAVNVIVVGGAGSVGRIGLYDSTPNNIPNNLLDGSGALDFNTLGIKEININRILTPGLYWVTCVVQVAVVASMLRGIGAAWSPFVGMQNPDNNAAGCGYIQAGVNGALPAQFVHSFANAGVFTGTCPRIMLRAV